MPVTLIIGAGIVMLACVAFVAVGSAYRWDVTAPGYGRWIRIVSVLALLGLSGLGVWDRRTEPGVAAAIAIIGIALAVVFVRVHVRLSEKVRRTVSWRPRARDARMMVPCLAWVRRRAVEPTPIHRESYISRRRGIPNGEAQTRGADTHLLRQVHLADHAGRGS